MHTAITENSTLPQRHLLFIFEWGGWKSSHKSAWVCLSWQHVHDFPICLFKYFLLHKLSQSLGHQQSTVLRNQLLNSEEQLHQTSMSKDITKIPVHLLENLMSKCTRRGLKSSTVVELLEWRLCSSFLPLSDMIMPSYPMLLTLGSTWDAKTISRIKGQVVSPLRTLWALILCTLVGTPSSSCMLGTVNLGWNPIPLEMPIIKISPRDIFLIRY